MQLVLTVHHILIWYGVEYNGYMEEYMATEEYFGWNCVQLYRLQVSLILYCLQRTTRMWSLVVTDLRYEGEPSSQRILTEWTCEVQPTNQSEQNQ